MRRKATADVDSLRIVDVVASFQLDSLVVVSPTTCSSQHQVLQLCLLCQRSLVGRQIKAAPCMSVNALFRYSWRYGMF